MNIVHWENKLIGFGCDGASVNLSTNGLKGFLEERAPWVVTFWCLAHRLELSSKALFSTIDEMLLRLYFIYYEKSLKKCCDLDEVVQSLKDCLESSEMPVSQTKGNRPLCSCGTRFVNHKVVAMGRLVKKYGAYICHLVTLTEDNQLKL